MTIRGPTTQPEIPPEGNLTVLKIIERLLTPREIEDAVKKGLRELTD